MPEALKITAETLTHILAKADEFRLNGQYIQDVYEYATQNGHDAYVIMDGREEWNNICYTTMWDTEFASIWKFTDDETGTHFQKIVKL